MYVQQVYTEKNSDNLLSLLYDNFISKRSSSNKRTSTTSIHLTPMTQVVSGNNSSAYEEHQNLKDSVQTHLHLNIAGGTLVCSLLIIAVVIIFLIWRAQKIAFSTFHTRLHHLSKFVNFPNHEEENSEQNADSKM